MMGRYKGVIGLAMLLAGSPVQAATTDSVNITVTVTCTLSVNIPQTALALGSVLTGQTVQSGGAAAVTNDGTCATETFAVSLANPAGWTASQVSSGANQYVLNAAFDGDGSLAWSNVNHALSTAPVASSATKFASDQSGLNVPAGQVRQLWFQFSAPTSTTVTTQQAIGVTVTAQP